MNTDNPESPVLSTQYGWITPSEQERLEEVERTTNDKDNEGELEEINYRDEDDTSDDVDPEESQEEEGLYKLVTRGNRMYHIGRHNIPTGLYQVGMDPFLYILLTESNEMNDDLRKIVNYVESFRPHRDVINLEKMAYRQIYCLITKKFNIPRLDYYWLNPWYNICDKLNEVWVKYCLLVFQESCSIPVYFGGSGFADASVRYLNTLDDAEMLLMLYTIKFRDLSRCVTLL